MILTKIPCPRCGSTIFFDETFCEQCGYIKTDKEVGYGEGSDDSNVEPTPIPPPPRNHGGGASIRSGNCPNGCGKLTLSFAFAGQECPVCKFSCNSLPEVSQ